MSRRSKIRAEDKIRTVKECIHGNISQYAAAERIRLYQTEGVPAFLPKEGNRRYDPAEKEAAVRDYLAGKDSIRGICKTYRIRSISARILDQVYNNHKDFKKQTGGSRMTKGREKAERVTVVKACIANGRSYGEITIVHNVSYQQAQQSRTELEQAQIKIEEPSAKKLEEIERRRG